MTFEGSTLQTNISDHVPGNQSRLEAYGFLVTINVVNILHIPLTNQNQGAEHRAQHLFDPHNFWHY